MPLSAKQQRFVAEYLKDSNATQAAIRAGYSKTNARNTGSRMLTIADVASAITKHVQQAGITADVILGELLRIARVDIGQAYDPSGYLLPLKEMPEDVRRAIAGIDVEEMFDGSGEERRRVGNVVKVKFWDKPRSLELLGKHLKLFTDKLEHSGNVSVNVVDPYALPHGAKK